MRLPFLRAMVVVLAATASPAWAWFGPSAESPYALVDTPAAQAPGAQELVVWRWVEARTAIETENRPTQDGYALGDAVFAPRPGVYLERAFATEVFAHEERDALLEKLRGATVRLVLVEIDVGLWARLTQRQSSSWETVRVKVAVEVNGQRYEALQAHPFRSRERPSPVATPMREAVQSLVQQILLF